MTRLPAPLPALVPLALLLGGCAVLPVPIRSVQPTPDAAWLVGTWLPVGPEGEEYPLACSSDAPVRFNADGRFVTQGEGGRWRVDGDRLTLTTTGVAPAVTRVERVGADVMRQQVGGRTTELRRCPPAR